MGKVLVDDLQTGMTLNSDVTDPSGRLLLRSGTVMSKENIRVLKNRGVEEVDIEGIEDKAAEPDVAVQPEPSDVDETGEIAVDDPAPVLEAPIESDISKEDQSKIRIMRATSFFGPFTDRELPVILGTSKWLRCGSGDIILREGESSDPSFFVVLKGSICIQKRLGGSNMKKTLFRLKRGECFGEMSVITSQPRSADAVAEGETFVLKIDADTLNRDTDSFEMRSIQFKFYKAFSEILAHRLAYTDALACKLT